MNNSCLQIRQEAKRFLSELSIIDADATINTILLDLSNTDDSNFEIKKQTLENIRNLIIIKNKLKVKNDDFYYLKSLSEKLKNNIKIQNNDIDRLFDIIKNNF